MTLTRQMYCDNSQHLMRHFKEETEKPFGYLLIELKPRTPELMRMSTDVFKGMAIKEHGPMTTSSLQRTGEKTAPLDSYEEVYTCTSTFEIIDSSLGTTIAFF